MRADRCGSEMKVRDAEKLKAGDLVVITKAIHAGARLGLQEVDIVRVIAPPHLRPNHQCTRLQDQEEKFSPFIYAAAWFEKAPLSKDWWDIWMFND